MRRRRRTGTRSSQTSRAVEPPSSSAGPPTSTLPAAHAAGGIVIDTLSQVPPSTLEIPPGTRLGRFEIEHRIGAGAMGVVYCAHDPNLDRRIAVKLINGTGPESAARQPPREARFMAQLSHPNIVVVHDAGEVDGRKFIAMELIDGESLPVWLTRPRPRREILRRFDQAGRGLAAAHRADIVHRDFKPSNVLIGADGRARVVDFGVACWLDDATATEPGTARSRMPDSAETRSSVIPGTPAYMAPEQRSGAPTTARSDQYSFCVSLWEALSGARPDHDKPPRRIPRAVRRVLERGLAESPADRWPSMDALLHALSRVSVRWHWTAVVAALAAAAAIGATMIYSSGRPACPPAAERLIGVWDGARKTVVREAFLATRLPYAERQWQTVEQTIDRYAADWASRSDAVCVAARVHETAAPLLDRRRACLDRRLDHLRSWGNVFAVPSAALVRTAVQAAAGLEDLAICDDPEPPDDPVPTDPTLAASVKALRERLADEQLRASYGPYKQAVAALLRTRAEAEQLGYRPLVGESLAALGKAEQDGSDFQAALTTWLALRDLSEETHEDLQRARAWGGLAFTYANLSQYDKTHDAVRVASSIVRPLSGTAVQSIRIGLEADDANAWWGEGQLERALALFRQTGDELAKLYGPASYRLARNEVDLAGLLLDMRRFDEAESLYARALERLLAMNGDAHPAVAVIANNQGDLYFRKRDYARALERYREALAIKDRAGLPANGLSRGYTVMNIGETLVQLGRPEEAVAPLRQALEIVAAQVGETSDNFLEALTWLGLAELGSGHPIQATTQLERAVTGLTQSTARSPQLAEAQFGLARALRDAHPDQRIRARQLASAARAAFTAAHDDVRSSEAEAWITSRPR